MLLTQTGTADTFIDESAPPVDYIEGAPWKEDKGAIPPLPKDSDLIEFAGDEADTRYRYYIDASSLSVGEDGVVRFILLIESEQGVRNFSYEGLRCETKEYKVYAYGSPRGLRPRKNPQWRPIKSDSSSGIHKDLERYYLCDPMLASVLERKRIVAALKGRENIRAHHYLKTP